MAITTVRRTGAFLVALALLTSIYVVAAPAAFSQGPLAQVSTGECVDDVATVSVALSGGGVWAFLARDADGVQVPSSYTNSSTHAFAVPEGAYTWIVFGTSDSNKVPVESGSFEVSCDVEETTTTTVAETTTTTTAAETTTTTQAAETTTTTVQESPTTTEAEVTTTAPDEPTTTVGGEAAPTTTVQQTSTTVAQVTASTLPFTGPRTGELAMIAGLAMVAGCGLLLLAGRRDRREAEGSLGRW